MSASGHWASASVSGAAQILKTHPGPEGASGTRGGGGGCAVADEEDKELHEPEARIPRRRVPASAFAEAIRRNGNSSPFGIASVDADRGDDREDWVRRRAL